LRLFAYQADVVLDVLDDIHEKHQIGIRLMHRSSKEQRLSDAFLIAIFGIVRVDTRRQAATTLILPLPKISGEAQYGIRKCRR